MTESDYVILQDLYALAYAMADEFGMIRKETIEEWVNRRFTEKKLKAKRN